MRLTQKSVVAAGLAGFIVATVTLIAPNAPAHAAAAQPSRSRALNDEASFGQDAHLAAGHPAPVPRASVFPCDLLSHVCVKLNKGETKWIAAHTGALSGGGIAGAGAICNKIPIPWTKVVCIVAVGVGGGALADSFDRAASQGKCVELHFSLGSFPLGPPGGLTHWKTEGC